VLFEMMHDGIDDELSLVEDIAVWETKHAITLRDEPFRTFVIVRHVSICTVLITVKLDDQFRR